MQPPPDAPEPEGFLPQGGNYRELLSFRKSETVFDFTFRFCDRFLKKGDRTIDQMVQSARSGKQNIGEGCKASITSAEMELKLVNVARASLEELLLDYQDYLRVRDHALWEKNSKEALYVRKLGRTPDESYETYRQFMDTRPPEVLANIAICLIHQANYLLDQQRRRLEKDFVKKGGIREQMTKARLEYRKKQQSRPPPPPTPPPPPSPPTDTTRKPPNRRKD
jgi:four helix bundle suffix protein